MRRVFFLVILAGLLPVPAAAQRVRVEVAGGYSVLNYGRDELPDLQPVGLFGAVAIQPAHWFAIATEIAAEFDTDSTVSPRVKRNAFAFLDGPRFTLSPRTMPWGIALFGEVLFGIAHDEGFTSDSSSANYFVWQPGLGVDVRLSEQLSVRFQASSRHDAPEFSPIGTRFTSGLVVTGRRSAREIANVYKKARADADKARADAEKAKSDADRAKADADKTKPGATKEAEARVKEAEARIKEADARVKEAEARIKETEKR
jgi:hypothetical protein